MNRPSVRNLFYAGVQDTNKALDLYFPHQRSEDTPLVVYIHGGGYFTGDKADERSLQVGELVSAGGFVCASVNYVLAPTDDRFARWPENMHDVATAIEFLLSHASRYSYDPKRVGLLGCSAGAALAALYAIGAGQLLGSIGFDGDWVRPRALVFIYGPFDYRTRSVEWRPTSDRLAAEISPAYWMERNVSHWGPPTLSIHGDRDEVVDFSQHTQMHAAYSRYGARFEPIVAKGFGHSFYPRDTGPDGREIDLGPGIVAFLNRYLHA